MGGENVRTEYNYMNEGMIYKLQNLPLVKVLIVILLVVIAVSIIMRLIGLRSLFQDKGVSAELENINAIKKRDKYILRANNILRKITRLVNSSGLSLGSNKHEYMEYNLRRAGVKVPGGFRNMTPEEFNACCKLGSLITGAIGLIVLIFLNLTFGALIILGGSILWNTVPMMVVRGIVADRDAEIKRHFFDVYLMLHYTLIANAQTPIAQLLRSYGKQTSSKEMIAFTANCVDFLDTYGEYNATRMIAREYREIAEVGRLMRLIRQQQEGGDITQELLGFKSQLVKERAYEVEVRMNKLINRANESFKVLMIILVQAIVSAMAIYLPDIVGVTSFF